MPKNVGRYQQGDIKTMEARGDVSGGQKMPQRAAPAGNPPANQLPVRDNGNTVGNNDAHEV